MQDVENEEESYTKSIEDAIQECNVTKRTIDSWIKKKIIRSEHKVDKIYLNDNDVKYLSSIITVRAAAKDCDVDYQFLLDWLIEKNQIIEPQFLNNKSKYYVKKTWILSHISEIEKNYSIHKGRKHTRKKQNLGKRLMLFRDQMRLFDFISVGKKNARIISLEHPVKYITTTGDIEILGDENIGQSKPCMNSPYAGYAGQVTFHFYYANLLNEIEALDKLVYCLGERNIMVFEQHDGYRITCRYGLIPYNAKLFHVLSESLIDGSVWEDMKGNIVIGDYELRIAVPVKYKDLIAFETLIGPNEGNFQNWVNDKLKNLLKENR